MSVSHFLKSDVHFGRDANGRDVKFWTTTSGDFVLWDASDKALEFTDANIAFTGGEVLYLRGATDYIVSTGANTLKIVSAAINLDGALTFTGNLTLEEGDILYFGGTNDYITSTGAATLQINSTAIELKGTVAVSDDLTMASGKDIILPVGAKIYFDGDGGDEWISSTGENKLKMTSTAITLAGTVAVTDDLTMTSGKYVYFRDTADKIASTGSGELNITSLAITLTGAVSVTDDLTMASGKDLILPQGAYLHFDGDTAGENIVSTGDGKLKINATDLTIAATLNVDDAVTLDDTLTMTVNKGIYLQSTDDYIISTGANVLRVKSTAITLEGTVLVKDDLTMDTDKDLILPMGATLYFDGDGGGEWISSTGENKLKMTSTAITLSGTVLVTENLTMTSGKYVYFRGTADKIVSTGAGELNITSTAITLTGTVEVSGAMTPQDEVTLLQGKHLYLNGTSDYIYSTGVNTLEIKSTAIELKGATTLTGMLTSTDTGGAYFLTVPSAAGSVFVTADAATGTAVKIAIDLGGNPYYVNVYTT